MLLPHKSCEQRLRAKCQWEHMTRLAVMLDWPDIVCRTCRKRMADAYPVLKAGPEAQKAFR